MALVVTFLLILFGFAVTSLTIPLVKAAAFKYGLVSSPGGRRAHLKPTPLLGGLAIYLPFAVVFLSFFSLLAAGKFTLDKPDKLNMLSLFLGTSWILILGTIDDKIPMGWRKKLLGQLLGGIILVLGGHTIATATIPLLGPVTFGWYGIIPFVLAVIIVTNAINLIDGLDGLAGGVCFFAALTSGVIALVKGDFFTALIGFTISGSLLGFLMFNFPPASIFLGDGGSMMLGFLLGTLATSSAAVFPGQRFGTSLMILVPFLPFGIPLFEVALSVVRRWIKGQAIFMGDGNHLHHRLIEKIKNPRLTVAIFYVFSAALCALTLFTVLEVQSMIVKFLGGLITLVLFGGALASISLYKMESVYVILQNRPHFKFLGEFIRFMKQRIRKAKSLQELLSLLESGVRDLGFNLVEVLYDGQTLKKWVNPQPLHPETPLIQSEDTFEEFRLTVKWTWSSHRDETYNEYLMLTWYRLLVAFRAEIANHSWELPRTQKNNVVGLIRKYSE